MSDLMMQPRNDHLLLEGPVERTISLACGASRQSTRLPPTAVLGDSLAPAHDDDVGNRLSEYSAVVQIHGVGHDDD